MMLNPILLTRRAPAAALIIFVLCAARTIATAQDSTSGKLSFDVASIKRNLSGAPGYRASSNFPLGPGESYSPSGGRLSATNFGVSSFIAFAYKLTSRQSQALQSEMPKWANEERFDVEARAAGDATKDQMRLMMQSLLADRFKLVVHRETHEGPVFALVLAKPGQTGPQLHVHSSDSPACGAFTLSAAARNADGSPTACDVFLTLVDSDRVHTSARNVSMAMIAGAMPLPGMGTLDRPVVDQTGLSGTFDFSIDCAPEGAAGPSVQANETEPTFLEALKDQLGLKLESTTAQIETLHIDHIEEPSPN
jgi:uncharacterized protein (TIGR03435 family)